VNVTHNDAPDVIVIGGGILGVSAAAELAETGRRVVLLERIGIGAGASGRNSGVVQHPFDPVLASLYVATLECYRRLADRVDDGFRLPGEPVGLLSVTHDVALVRRLAQRLAEQFPELRPTFLDPAAARSVEPSLAEGVAACRLEVGFPIAPIAATGAYARLAELVGVEIRTDDVAGLWQADGRARGVILADGSRLAAGSVVVAAGPWSPALIDPTGRWRPIRPLWGVVATIRLADPPGHVLEEAEIDIEPGAAPDATAGIDFSLVTAAGATSLGSTFLSNEPDGASLVPALVARGARFVPALAGAIVEGHRQCARPLSVDGRPLVGRIPWVEDLWIAAGHGPWGISTGPASATLLAALMNETEGSPPSELDPGRFGTTPPPAILSG